MTKHADRFQEKLNKLSPLQRQLLEKKLLEKRNRTGEKPAKKTTGSIETGPFPLSFSQEAIWLTEQMSCNASQYHTPFAVKIAGPLDETDVRRAVVHIINNNPAFRTVFGVDKDRPFQTINGTSDLIFTRKELNGRNLDQAVHDTLAEELDRPFDLEKGPVVRFALIRADDREHLLLINAHHLVMDGWSKSVFTKQLFQYLETGTDGDPDATDAASPYIQYLSGIAENRNKGRETENAFWQDAVSGINPVSITTAPVGTDKKDHPVFPFSVPIPSALIDCVKRYAADHSTTLFMVMLAGFYTLIYRYTGESATTVGTYISNRSKKALQSVIGCLMSGFPISVEIDGNQSFATLCKTVGKQFMDVSANRNVSLPELAAEVRKRHPGPDNPLFATIFHMRNFPDTEFTGTDLSVIGYELPTTFARSDLMFEVRPDPGMATYTLHLDGKDERYDHAVIDRMTTHYFNILAHAMENPSVAIKDIPMLTDTERDTILHTWNDTGTDYPSISIPAAFRETAARYPDKTAIIFNQKTMTYRELDRQSDILAARLIEQGVQPGEPVCTMLPRSDLSIVSFLGILKAGGAYAPIDPDYPVERIRMILDTTGVRTLVSTEAHLDTGQLKSDSITAVLADEVLIATESPDPACCFPDISPESTAYLNFTSGSGGAPKTVVVPHKGVLRLVRNTNYMDFTDDLVFLHASSVSFDAATFEIWGGLLNGSTVAVYAEQLHSFEDLSDFILQTNVSVIFFTTALFNRMAEACPRFMTNLKYLLQGGEIASAEGLQSARKSFPGMLYNMYGPTENTTYTTWYPVESTDSYPHSVPIGKPISNSRVYILDKDMNILPAGVPGQIWIGGDGLADGYHGNPSLTEEKFVHHSWNGASERLYNSGDIGCYRNDGNILFMGRSDEQLKVRGFRLEPDEIEARLRQFDGIVDCAVHLVRKSETRTTLAAAIVPRDNREILPERLKTELKRYLPDYMIPSKFLFLEKIPLTTHGKVDRNALARLADDEPDPRPEQVRETVTEGCQRIINIWAELFGTDIGPGDNFFDLGGDSLTAAQVIFQIGQEENVRMGITDVFNHPTPEALANLVTDRQSGEALAQTPSRSAGEPPAGSAFSIVTKVYEKGQDLSLFWIHNPRLPYRAHEGTTLSLTVYSVRLDELRLSEPAFADTVYLAKTYCDAVREYVGDRPVILSGYCASGRIAYATACQLRTHGIQVEKLILIDGSPPRAIVPLQKFSLSYLASFLKNLPLVLEEKIAQKELVPAMKRLFSIGCSFIRKILFGEPMDTRVPHPDQSEDDVRWHSLYDYRPETLADFDIHFMRTRACRLLGPFYEDLGWQFATHGKVTVTWLKGYHLSIIDSQIDELTRPLEDVLKRSLK